MAPVLVVRVQRRRGRGSRGSVRPAGWRGGEETTSQRREPPDDAWFSGMLTPPEACLCVHLPHCTSTAEQRRSTRMILAGFPSVVQRSTGPHTYELKPQNGTLIYGVKREEVMCMPSPLRNPIDRSACGLTESIGTRVYRRGPETSPYLPSPNAPISCRLSSRDGLIGLILVAKRDKLATSVSKQQHVDQP